jgi:hypothetical protein
MDKKGKFALIFSKRSNLLTLVKFEIYKPNSSTECVLTCFSFQPDIAVGVNQHHHSPDCSSWGEFDNFYKKKLG